MSLGDSRPTAIVVGGGVIGLTTARELVLAGHQVTVIDKGVLAGQASWAGGGILSPLPPWQADSVVWELARESREQYSPLCASLAQKTGIDPEFWVSGMDVLTADHREALAWGAAEHLAVLPVRRDFGAGSVEALHLPWVAQIRNPRFCRALVAWLSGQGVVLIEHCPVTEIDWTAGQAVVRHARGMTRAGTVVIAAGAWTGALLAGLGWPLPVTPVKGQMLALQDTAGEFPHIVLSGSRYLIPRRDGVLLVGSTLEDTGFDNQATSAVAAELREFATTLCPRLATAPSLGHWAGLRPGSPQGRPFIARHPQYPRIAVNGGHFRYGLTMALASAKRLLTVLNAP